MDRIIFLGSRGDDEALRRLVKMIVVERRDARVLVADERVAEESLFVTASGIAVVARRGMVHGFDACIVPDWCEVDNSDGDEEGIKGEKGNEKLEL